MTPIPLESATQFKFDATKTAKENQRLAWIEERQNLYNNLNFLDLTKPEYNEAGAKTQDVADKQIIYNNCLTRISVIDTLLQSFESNSTLLSSISSGDDWGAIEAIKLHYENIGGWSTEWGQPGLMTATVPAVASINWNRRMLAMLLGMEFDPTAAAGDSYIATRFPDNYRRFAIKKVNKNINKKYYECSIYNEGHTMGQTGTYYSYAPKGLSIRAWKNTSSVAKTLTFTLDASMYSTYNPAWVSIFTPNKDNSQRSAITSLTNIIPYSNIATGTTSFATVSFTIPANTSVIVMLCASDYLFNGTLPYQFDRMLRTKGEDSFDPAIVQDHDIFNNIVSSTGMGGKVAFTTLEQLFTLTPVLTNTDKLNNPTLLFKATDDADAATKGVLVNGAYLANGVYKLRLV